MDFSYIKRVIEDNYLLKVDEIEKVKNTYKVVTEEGGYCVKVVNYQYPHFYFIISAINHLQRRGFSKIPEILLNKDKGSFIELKDKYVYLTKWIPSRASDYDNLDELARVSRKLGELHKCSEGFILSNDMKPRIGWYSWIEVFETRCKEILDFKNRINQKAYKSEFDGIYLDAIEIELEKGKQAIRQLKKNRYIQVMDKEVIKRGFCHHDFAHHNVLIDEEDNINIIDFDYCMLDSHIHDLSSIIIRAMKGNKWSVEKGNLILNNYSKKYNLYDEEMPLMKAFIKFPQEFWQIGLQYYWEQQPWGEEFMVKKIKKYLADTNNRENFIETFFN